MGENNKGGWTAEAWDREGLTVSAYGRGIIARCPVPQDGGTMDCVANARLIAAAPELYEALEDLVAQVSQDGKLWAEIESLLKRARFPVAPLKAAVTNASAALATARGSS